MSRLVPFYCPAHGEVVSAPVVSRVECRCGQECAPEGLTPSQHRARYHTARRVRRNRYSSAAKPQVRRV